MIKCVNQSEKREYSQLIFGEQVFGECEKSLKRKPESYLTLKQFESMSHLEKICIQNHVCQWALKARDHLPDDHAIFCLVLAHLLKNAHRYFNFSGPSEMQTNILQMRQLVIQPGNR